MSHGMLETCLECNVHCWWHCPECMACWPGAPRDAGGGDGWVRCGRCKVKIWNVVTLELADGRRIP